MLFAHARSLPRAIIFFDEFDSIALSRGGSDEGCQGRRVLAELLLQISFTKDQQKQRQRDLQTKTGNNPRADVLQPIKAAFSTGKTSCGTSVTVSLSPTLLDIPQIKKESESVLGKMLHNNTCMDAQSQDIVGVVPPTETQNKRLRISNFASGKNSTDAVDGNITETNSVLTQY